MSAPETETHQAGPIPDRADISLAFTRALKVLEGGTSALSSLAEHPETSDEKLVEDIHWTMRMALRHVRKVMGAKS